MNCLIRWSFTAFVALCIFACQKAEEQAADTLIRPVKTITLGDPGALEKHTFPAVVDAFQKADLSFRIPGELEKIYVKEGDEVQKGDRIAVLDQKDYEIRLNSAEAELMRTRSDFQRAEKLVKKGHVSQADFDKLRAAYQIAQANYDAAKKNLADTVLLAPFDGTVAMRYIESYEDVSAMSPIVSLQDVSRLTIKVNIPESIMIRTNRERAPPKIIAEFEAIPGKQFPLTINEVSTQADEKAGTYRLSLLMDNPKEHTILPGMSATVTGQRDTSKTPGSIAAQTYIIPPIAVLEDNNGRFVYLAQAKAGEHYQVIKKSVQTGELFEGGLEIISGLQTGDKVIVAGVSQMREGMQVKLIGEVAL